MGEIISIGVAVKQQKGKYDHIPTKQDYIRMIVDKHRKKYGNINKPNCGSR